MRHARQSNGHTDRLLRKNTWPGLECGLRPSSYSRMRNFLIEIHRHFHFEVKLFKDASIEDLGLKNVHFIMHRWINFQRAYIFSSIEDAYMERLEQLWKMIDR